MHASGFVANCIFPFAVSSLDWSVDRSFQLPLFQFWPPSPLPFRFFPFWPVWLGNSAASPATLPAYSYTRPVLMFHAWSTKRYDVVRDVCDQWFGNGRCNCKKQPQKFRLLEREKPLPGASTFSSSFTVPSPSLSYSLSPLTIPSTPLAAFWYLME